MKILFYDVRNFELDYLLEKIPGTIEGYFLKIPLNNKTYIDEKYADCEAISIFVSSYLDKNTLSKFPNLKYIFLRCVGYSNVDIKYCKENNIYVFNTPNYGNATVAEYTFSLLLALSRKIIQANNSILTGEINQDNLCGIELSNKTIGVIGVGAIGRKVINIAHGFNMEVLAYDPNPKGAYNFVELEELLKKSDFICVNCPLNSTTKNLINKTSLSKMKQSAILINTARGEIVNTKDLYMALINKKIKGATLDVIECEETLCNNYMGCEKNDFVKENCLKKFFFIQKMMRLDNVIITPHIAYNTVEAQKRILNITLQNIKLSLNNNISGTKNLVLL